MKKSIVLLFATTLLTLNSLNSHAQNGNTGIGTATPGSKLTINGSFAATYNNITATTYTMTAGDYYLAWNGSAAGTVTLPAYNTFVAPATSIGGRIYHIKNTSPVPLTVQASGSELIDNQTGPGLASITIDPGSYAMIVSKGTTSGTTWEVALMGNGTSAGASVLLQYKNTATQFVTTGSGAVQFPTKIFDRGNNFNTATNTFTAPTAGYYLFSVFGQISGANLTMSLNVNGVVFQQFSQGGQNYMATCFLSLNAGDLVKVMGSAPGNFNITGANFSAIKLSN